MSIINSFLRIFNNNLFKYFPWFLLGLLSSFLISDFDVKALENSQLLYIGSTGTYGGRTFIKGVNYNFTSLNQTNIAGSSYFEIPVNNEADVPISSSTSFRFDWTLPGSYLKGRNTIEFIVGSRVNYPNIGYLALPGQGYIGCNIKSQSPMIQNKDNYYFTSFSCPYDKKFVSESDMTIYFISTANPYVADNNLTYTNIFYLNNMVITYLEGSSEKIDEVIKNQDQVQQEINDLNDSITSSDVDTGALDDIQVNNGNGVLSSILTLPLRFFTNLNNSLSTAKSSAESRALCSGISVNLPFVNMPFTLPCGRELLNSMGALQFYESIGLLCGGLCMFYYILHLGKQLSDMMTLKEIRAEWGGL